MRRYFEVFLMAALFCFLFPFTAVRPAPNTDVFPLTGWDMLRSQNIAVSKQPPLVLNFPVRASILLALICGGIALVVRVAKRDNQNLAWVPAAGTCVAAIALLMTAASSPLVLLTDGQKVVHQFENPTIQLLPAFYISLVFMVGAAVSSLMNLKQPAVQAGAAFTPRPRTFPTAAPAQSARSGASSSFCIQCGGSLAPAARFCNRCGAAVVDLNAAAKPAQPPPAAQ